MAVAVKHSCDMDSFLRADGIAVYASCPNETRGRIYNENSSGSRSEFQRDRDRIIHSRAFRRLKHKTQVFVYNEGDHYRTRLSHSLEVAQVARSLARSLHVDEDLAEACSLAHDLGHTPFAHVGEEALKISMEPYGGFDHNDQTLRVVTQLENRYPDFDGMNLTWETIEGLVKHGGPVKGDLEFTLKKLSKKTNLMLENYASVEAQISGISDDVAYNSHDLDDGLTAGYFKLDELSHIPLLNEIIYETKSKYPNVEKSRFNAEVVRELMGAMIKDVREETKKRLLELSPKSADDVRNADFAVVAFSEEMEKTDKMLRAFLWDRFYLHKNVSRQRLKIEKVVQGMFNAFLANERVLPDEWRGYLTKVPDDMLDTDWRARVVADYIANMTDRYAILTHRELFDPYAQL